MKRNVVLSLSVVLASASLAAQVALPPGASPQAAQDPGYQALIATCKTPPPARGGGPGGGGGGVRPGGPPAGAPGAPGAAPGGAPPGAPPGAATAAAPATFPPPPANYAVTEIPGVIAAGQTWTKVWETSGNNADGILADKDGNLLIAQNHNSAVVKLDRSGKVSPVYSDTHTGGALAVNKKGDTFMVQRGLRQNVTQLTPKRRILADKLPNGDPLDCQGGVINDLTADSKGGVYFTMGGLFHAAANGTVTRYGENLSTNGVILSPDEKRLYVTNQRSIAAFDVQGDGSLTNQRTFVELPSAGGDGLTVDAQGRLYVTAGPALHVVSPEGKLLGSIPAPYSLITAAFAGPDKKTMYAVTSLINPATRFQSALVFSIPMIAQGYKDRPK